MALTKPRSDNNIVYLEAKHHCLWRPIKKRVEGCDEVEANNPTTGTTVLKYGYRFGTVTGHAIKLVKYDTGKKYQTRYFGFKLHLVEGAETYVLDMPYRSNILRRFLRVARNIDWNLPLSISVFKGRKKEGAGVEETGIWFQQRGETVKAYYTKEESHGMPEALFDSIEQQWDFKAQHRWLIERLQDETVPDIEKAAQRVGPPIEHDVEEQPETNGYGDPNAPDINEVPFSSMHISNDDVPF